MNLIDIRWQREVPYATPDLKEERAELNKVKAQITNGVIAGHRGYKGIPYFRNPDKLKAGDEVIITNFWGQMAYLVESTSIIQPNDLDEILIQEGRDLLTLLTCHPCTVGTQRLIILCKAQDECDLPTPRP